MVVQSYDCPIVPWYYIEDSQISYYQFFQYVHRTSKTVLRSYEYIKSLEGKVKAIVFMLEKLKTWDYPWWSL